jgi:hypothetical protein
MLIQTLYLILILILLFFPLRKSLDPERPPSRDDKRPKLAADIAGENK